MMTTATSASQHATSTQCTMTGTTMTHHITEPTTNLMTGYDVNRALYIRKKVISFQHPFAPFLAFKSCKRKLKS